VADNEAYRKSLLFTNQSYQQTKRISVNLSTDRLKKPKGTPSQLSRLILVGVIALNSLYHFVR
jgi:hypothetical protein